MRVQRSLCSASVVRAAQQGRGLYVRNYTNYGNYRHTKLGFEILFSLRVCMRSFCSPRFCALRPAAHQQHQSLTGHPRSQRTPQTQQLRAAYQTTDRYIYLGPYHELFALRGTRQRGARPGMRFLTSRATPASP